MPARVEIDDTKALELYNQGKSDNAIAAYFGCGISTIGRWRAAHDLSGRNGKVPAERKPKASPQKANPDPSDSSPEPAAHNPAAVMETAVIPSGLIKLLNDYPDAGILVDGLPIKSITVFSEYDLAGRLQQTHIGLLTE